MTGVVLLPAGRYQTSFDERTHAELKSKRQRIVKMWFVFGKGTKRGRDLKKPSLNESAALNSYFPDAAACI
jgi:hypothetical protein